MTKITIIIENELGRQTVIVESASHIEFKQHWKDRFSHWDVDQMMRPELEHVSFHFKPYRDENGDYLQTDTTGDIA